MNLSIRYKKFILATLRSVGQWLGVTWQKNLWNKFWLVGIASGIICLGAMYGIARWYITSTSDRPLTLGTTFIPAYADSLGVDPQKTMDALLDDAQVRHFRLVSYWDQLEPQKGSYDFSQLDWQFKKAEARNAKISLSIGLRQPRWPECHMPAWATGEPKTAWQPQLENFVAAVVNRYKDSPSLESYQLENEYFLKAFGTCTDFSRDRLVREYELVKKADPNHPVIISRSNNVLGMPIGKPQPDIVGVSIYKRVWSMPIGRYLEYPFPAWFYAFMAGTQKILTGKDMVIHELQAEAWPPRGQGIPETSLDEQNESLDATRLKSRIKYGKATGIRTIYLWGSEYWYYRMKVQHDPSLWDVAKDAYRTQ